eukprot:evm.model.scf_2923.1 EVM.evm.TU.scf_2923.1   scf_2923:10415-13763(+)
MMPQLDDKRKIGIGLTAFGVLFTFLGVLFFFDRGFLAMGNLLFVAGLTLTIGTDATLRFFRKNLQGSAFFLGGIAVVVYGWTMLGMGLELYGFWQLFRGFIPNVLLFFRKIPVLGKILDLPVLKTVRVLGPQSASFISIAQWLEAKIPVCRSLWQHVVGNQYVELSFPAFDTYWCKVVSLWVIPC